MRDMSEKTKVAIIDDEADMRQSVAQWMQLSGFEPVTFEAAEPALKHVAPPRPHGHAAQRGITHHSR